VKLSQRRLARPSLGGMLATRQGALILAVLCAVCAAGILIFAMSSYKRSVQTTVKQATVLVATGEIQKGTSGDAVAAEKLYRSMPVVADQLAPGAISNATQIQGQLVAADVLPGQQLTTADFTTTPGVGALLTPNQRAMSIPSDEVDSDLAVLQPGDRVDLYAEVGQGTATQMLLLIPGVLVIKTPSSGIIGAASTASNTTSSGSTSTGPIVLVVRSNMVPKVALAADQGKLWIALRPGNATNPPAGVTTIATLVAQAAAEGPAAGSEPAANAKTTSASPGGKS
jgi:Flp pilus assembly protein CpaB